MSGADIPKFSHEQPADSSRPDIFMGIYDLDLSDKMQSLREALVNDRKADMANYTFGFYDSDTLDDIYLPPQVQRLAEQCGSLTSVSVECTSPNDCDALSFVVCFDFKDESGPTTQLVVERPFDYRADQDSYDTATLHIVEDDDEDSDAINPRHHMTPISRRDFNCMLASLVYRGGNISIDAFASLNWHTENLEKTVRNFHCVADYSTSYEEYLFHSAVGGLAGVLRVNSYDEMVTDIQLDRIITHDISMDEHGTMNFQKRLIETWITPVGDPTVSFWACEERDNEKPRWEEMDPTAADYGATIEFIDHHIHAVRPTQFEVFDEDTTQPFED